MILTTPRLTLRPFTCADAPALSALAGDPRVARMLVDIPQPFDAAEARRWLRPLWGELRLGVEQGGRLIGGVTYFCRPAGVGSLGYWLGADHWGQGYASEAASALLWHGFGAERMQRFGSGHFIDNPASARVLQKLGFKPWGTAKVWCQARGEYVESAHYMLERAAAGFAPAWPTVAGMFGFRPLLARPVRPAPPKSTASARRRPSGSGR